MPVRVPDWHEVDHSFVGPEEAKPACSVIGCRPFGYHRGQLVSPAFPALAAESSSCGTYDVDERRSRRVEDKAHDTCERGVGARSSP
jgi:hypothetical protein